MATTKNTKSTKSTKATKSTKVTKPETPVERTFWTGDQRTDEFTCRVCGESKPFPKFTVVTVWDDDSRTRRTECRTCEADRAGGAR